MKRSLFVLLLLAGTAYGQARLGPCKMDGSDCGAAGVTSVGSGTISGLFTTSWATPTTTPALSLDFSAVSPKKFLAGSAGFSTEIPTFRSIAASDLGTTLSPTFNVLTVSSISMAGPSSNQIMGYGSPASAIGTLNTGFGNASLTDLTYGTGNTAFGSHSLLRTRSGDYNTAVGYTALYSNVDSSNNTAMGNSALYSNFSGNSNTAVGASALYGVTGSGDNTAMGANSLQALLSGSGNVAVGSSAGVMSGASPDFGNAQTGGSNNTFIGYQSGLGSSTQRSNATAIGKGAYVTASNTVVLGNGSVTEIKANSLGTANVTAGSFTGPVTALKSATTSVDVSAATAPSANQVLTATSSTAATWQTPATFTGALAAGTVSTPPLKFTSGPLLTTTQAGAVEFLSDTYYATITTGAGQTSFYPPAQSGTYVKATTSYDATADPWLATDPTKSLIGPRSGNSWMSLSGGGNVDQRFHIDLGSAVVVTKIMYHNFHASGIDTSVGVKNFTFWGSNTAGAFADTTYANDTNWTQITLGTTQFLEHAATDTPDPQYIDVPTGLPYRYYAFKFADNYGYVAVMGVRRIELQTGGPRKGILLNDGLALTAGRIPYVTTGGRLVDSSAITTDGATITATGFTGGSYRGVNVTGTNQAAADLPISSGLGTGTGTPSSVVISTPTVGVSGSAAQVAATRLTVNSTAVTSTVPVVIANSSPGTAALSFGPYPNAGLRSANNAQLEIISNNSRVAYTTAAGIVVNALSISGDVDLTRSGAATLQLGAANSATPVAQTLTFQGSRGGTDTNIAGVKSTITASQGTGTASGGDLSLQTGTPTTTGTSANVVTTRIYEVAAPKTLVSGAGAVNFLDITMPTDDTGVGYEVHYTFTFSDGTNASIHKGIMLGAAYRATGGTITASTPTEGSETNHNTSGGNVADTFGVVVGTGKITLTVTATKGSGVSGTITRSEMSYSMRLEGRHSSVTPL